jgi:hypothetical protein
MMQQQNLPNMSEKLEFLENYLLTHDEYLEEQRKEIKRNFSRFKSELKRRWITAHKKEDSFIAKNSVWLEGTFTIPTVVYRPGRPRKMFIKASDRTKRRTNEALRSAVDVEVLTHAAQVKLRSCGKRDVSQVLKDITVSPKRVTKYKRGFAMRQQDERAQTKMTPVSALAMFVEAGLSRRQYEVIRSTHKHISLVVFYKMQNSTATQIKNHIGLLKRALNLICKSY